MADSKYLEVAKKAAIEAGKIVKKYSNRELEFHNKGHFANFATQADLESEAKIIEIIKQHFPEHNIIAEESGGENHNSEYTWAIDPIDGTIPFVSGFPVYSVSVGLLKNDQPFIGVINQVGTGEIYWAEKGKGAFVNDKKIEVSKNGQLSDSLITLDFGHKERTRKLDRYFQPLVDKVRQPFVINAAAVSLAYLARGYFDGAAQAAHIWDFAAAAILIVEAGGKVTSFNGDNMDWSMRDLEIIASNSLIHQELVDIYK